MEENNLEVTEYDTINITSNEEQVIVEPVIVQQEPPVDPDVGDQIYATVTLEKNETVKYVLIANGQEGTIATTSSEIKLILGRCYYIPVTTKRDSDTFSILRIPSDIAGKIDVRFVKNGTACVIPIVNGVTISNDDVLAVMFS